MDGEAGQFDSLAGVHFGPCGSRDAVGEAVRLERLTTR